MEILNGEMRRKRCIEFIISILRKVLSNVKNEFSFIGIIPKYRGIINRFIWREKITIFFLYILECQMWEYLESSETIKLELRRKNRN